MEVQLNTSQKKLKNIIIENLVVAKDWQNRNSEEVAKAFEIMKTASHSLHMELDPNPKHHHYMITNRGMEPEDPEFYNHIHPVEDLLKYLADTSANDDPIDLTMGDTFEFQLYSSRWGHYDSYGVKRTQNGWDISHLSYRGEDIVHEEMTVLYSAMRHDSISFPRDVDIYMHSIWERAKDEGLTHEEVQEMLNQVAEWISLTEKSAPRSLLF